MDDVVKLHGLIWAISLFVTENVPLPTSPFLSTTSNETCRHIGFALPIIELIKPEPLMSAILPKAPDNNPPPIEPAVNDGPAIALSI